MTAPAYLSTNRLLGCLPASVLDALRLEFRDIELPQGREIELAGRTLAEVVFVESGVLSVFAATGLGSVEVGMVGREGMAGLPALFGCNRSTHNVVVQLSGRGFATTPERFARMLDAHPELRAIVLRYGHAHLAQISHCGLANARSTVTERVARWLLMCSDRSGEPHVNVTHETLSAALGVRRPGVTVATHMLEGEGAIRAKRGSIAVLDRLKLERLARGSYGAAEQEYEQLFTGFGASPALALAS